MEYRSPEREREHHAKLDEIGFTIDQQIMFTRILYTVGHMYTVNDKSDKHEPQLREFIELCPYANVCTHRPGCSAYR